jgi:glutamyl/glutaminyl-tRNA synthetase
VIDVGLLAYVVREDLNRHAPRAMAVLRPLKVVLKNSPDGSSEELDVVNKPEDPSAGTRKVPFSKVLYIEQDDTRISSRASRPSRTRQAVSSSCGAPTIRRRATRFQFERLGYFWLDPDSRPERPVFNRTVTLKDSWPGSRTRPEPHPARRGHTRW